MYVDFFKRSFVRVYQVIMVVVVKFVIIVNQAHGNIKLCFSFYQLLFSYNGGTCISTTTAYICQCTYPFSGSNCEIRLATQAPQSTCACVLCPCPTPAPTATNPCSY
jgi:hypothetical protein